METLLKGGEVLSNRLSSYLCCWCLCSSWLCYCYFFVCPFHKTNQYKSLKKCQSGKTPPFHASTRNTFHLGPPIRRLISFLCKPLTFPASLIRGLISIDQSITIDRIALLSHTGTSGYSYYYVSAGMLKSRCIVSKYRHSFLQSLRCRNSCLVLGSKCVGQGSKGLGLPARSPV